MTIRDVEESWPWLSCLILIKQCADGLWEVLGSTGGWFLLLWFWAGGRQGPGAHQRHPEHLHRMVSWTVGSLCLPEDSGCGYSLLIGTVACGAWGGRESWFSRDIPSRSLYRRTEIPAIVRRHPKLEICLRKPCGLIIAISYPAKKSKFSLRAAQKYKKRDWGVGRGMLQMCISRKEKE